MKTSWIIQKENQKLSEKIAKALEISPITAQLLINRGITTAEEAHQFLNSSLFDLPSPFLMNGMEKAVQRIIQAVENMEMIGIYGDYDVDGVTSTALFYNFLKEIGSRVTYYNPDRFTEGYGVNIEAIKKLADQGVKLIISGDCGITAVEEVEKAKELGIDFIVTDHHKPPKQIPDAVAVLNPQLTGCGYPAKEITGVGVIFNLVLALRRELRETGFFEGNEPNLGAYLDLVALGTVADCGSITNVNRILVKEGLKRMSSPKRQGLKALKEASSIKGDVSSFDIGYRLGPRINASGRLNTAKEAVELFISNDPQAAKELAGLLNAENSNRQGIEAKILEEAFSMIESEPKFQDSNSIVLASKNWHQGVIGIVASRIVDKYLKPTFLIAIDDSGMGKGSGRSLDGVNIYTALTKCSDFLEEFGGHDLAAGITIKEKNIDKFKTRFDKALHGFKDKYVKNLTVDAYIETNDLNRELISEFGSLAPHGIGNPEPVFLSKSLEVVGKKIFMEKHLSLKLKNGTKTYDAVWFNSNLELEPSNKIDIVFTPEINTWNGGNNLRLRIIDANLNETQN
ncbi:MAG: single-stranded-DNA-specific exonuclease RecJ [Candidatus Dadabacteria bacterium]|nr:single-stranded-DNA-specific exonuclease RecJ [Candidatus Dadabacteria bacterium]NIS09189.1 single-stranded-DNA-specific exonuclease RecJ [Candidatus Dadabacteria bacterium]NIV41805.1 single-stranded-DNA-specific exonuclease RecJ [Candidatus Dadabacteria bacterium]NIX15748.1 single-stranded-DNA-specific exonuclease RecJ [Candidatus Dadabacteria bacterium]NIY22620.1 single-stranded-DNA-specific exonuclease RecJ [Candidatus Dadabacteria bacterium]